MLPEVFNDIICIYVSQKASGQRHRSYHFISSSFPFCVDKISFMVSVVRGPSSLSHCPHNIPFRIDLCATLTLSPSLSQPFLSLFCTAYVTPSLSFSYLSALAWLQGRSRYIPISSLFSGLNQSLYYYQYLSAPVRDISIATSSHYSAAFSPSFCFHPHLLLLSSTISYVHPPCAFLFPFDSVWSHTYGFLIKSSLNVSSFFLQKAATTDNIVATGNIFKHILKIHGKWRNLNSSF